MFLGQSQTPFLGHVISAEGIHIDEGKVKGILSLPSPENAKDLRRLLGMVSYLARFLPQVQIIIQPLNLMSNKVAWY